MFTSYADFEIDVQRRDGDVLPFSVRSPGGEAHGTLRLPTSDPMYQQLAARLAAFDTDEDVLTQIGQILFNALFQGQIREVYARSQGLLSPGQGLRIKLCSDPAETEVAALPWEFMCDPDQIGPLALLDAPILHYIPLPIKVQTIKVSLPLRVLLSGAQTQLQNDVGRELREVAAALSTLGEYVQITVEPHLTPASLQRRMREGFDIWHFVGHGEVTDDGKTGRLLLEDNAYGHSVAVSAPELGILLNRSGVRLVVLDTWDGSRLTTDPFRSLAPALVRAQVPAVVAMQFKVPEDVTRVFAKNFYQALAEGFPIDTCMTEGRKGVMNATGLDHADWGIPIAYTHASDGMLFDLPAPVTATLNGTIVSNASTSGAIAATVAIHGAAGTLLSTPPLISIERFTQVPAPPRRRRNFINREQEQQKLEAELRPAGGAWLSGPLGCGLSALLNQAAASEAARALRDGIPWVEGAFEPPHLDDILQRLFNRFYATSTMTHVDSGMAQTYLSQIQALFVLDRLPLSHTELVRLTVEILPSGAVLIAGDDEAPDALLDLPLGGLPRTEAIRLCAAQAKSDVGQPGVAAQLEPLCAALGDLPLPLLLVGRLIRCHAATADQLMAALEEMTRRGPQLLERAVGQHAIRVYVPTADQEALSHAAQLSLKALSDDEQHLLAAVVVGQPDVSLAQLTESMLRRALEVETALARLIDLGLVTRGADRYGISTSSLRHVLELLLQPTDARRQAAAFFTGAVALHVGDLDWLGRERGNIMGAIQTWMAEGRPTEAGALAKALQPAAVLHGLWSSWGDIIDWAGQSAQQRGDQALEAWALHERGTRAGLIGDRTTASDALDRALRLRKQLGDQIGIAATRRNMAYLDLFPPVPKKTSWRDRIRRHRLPFVAGAVALLLSVAGISIAVSALALGTFAPVLTDDQATTKEDTSVAITVLINDADRAGAMNPASVHVVAGPSNGSARPDPATGIITYTPNRNFNGDDRFTYNACDERRECASANVTVIVQPINDPPVAGNDVASTNEDTPIEIDVTMNDTDVEDGHPVTVAPDSKSEKGGTLTMASRMVKYIPPANFNGVDHFSYTAIDNGGVGATAMVTLNIQPVNDAPTFTKGPDQSAPEDAASQVVPWARDISSGPPDEASQSLSFLVTTATPELFVIQPTIDSVGKLTYTPALAHFGTATITVTLRDNGGTANGGLDTSAPQTFTITISHVNHTPIAQPDMRETNEDTPFAIPVADLLRNDTDVDAGDVLTITAADRTSAKNGSLMLSGDTLTYTPAADFNGQDNFTYTLSDGHGGEAEGTVTVMVAPVNDNPVATDDLAATNEATPVLLDVLANDSDIENNINPGSVRIISDPANGRANVEQGQIVYTPNGPDPDGRSAFTGTDSFTYEVCDTGTPVLCSTAIVTVTVQDTTPPVIINLSADHSDTSYTYTCKDNVLVMGAVMVQADVSDSSGIASVTLRYRYLNSAGTPGQWHTAPMQPSQSGRYVGTIENAQEASNDLQDQSGILEYTVDAVDKAKNSATSASQMIPIRFYLCVY